MQEKKGGIPGRKRFGKGKDCYDQKDHSRQWQKQKEGENICYLESTLTNTT